MTCQRCYGDLEVGKHGWKVCPLQPRHETGFNTHGDLRYTFITTHVKPGTEIRSKGQWERFLRVNNLTDSLKPKELMDMASRGYQQKKSHERRDKLSRELRPILGQALQASR